MPALSRMTAALATLVSLHAAAGAPLAPAAQTHALVPAANCTAALKVCYQGSPAALEQVAAQDPLSCPGKRASLLLPGTCLAHGYSVPHGHDPIFQQTLIFTRHAARGSGELLERCEARGKRYTGLTGRRAVVITTSHDRLGPANCSECKPTGVASPEFTIPFYLFQDAGIAVTLASIRGGEIPVDSTARYMTHWDARFWSDPAAIAKALDSPAVGALDLATYDLVYMAGGWGAAWDLGMSKPLASGISAAYKAGKVLGSVCHGALGFINATAPDGSVLVQAKNMSAVTNRQIEQLGIASITPMHPETELRARGANFEASHGLLTDVDQSYVAVDGKLVTGQNQNSACETAQRMMDLLV